jgi:hypothetical protein
MAEQPATHRVEVTFTGSPPARQVATASGVRDVQVDGSRLTCLVEGSFQPFLEALRGYEVISLTSSPPSTRGGD